MRDFDKQIKDVNHKNLNMHVLKEVIQEKFESLDESFLLNL